MAEGLSWSKTWLAERRLQLTEKRAVAVEAGFVLLACALFLAFVLPNLANHPAPTDDEIWILSASHKLATEGVFGTDLFAGFYRADEVYFFNMPLHHLVLAAVFKIAGTSVLAGRLVSVAYGLAAIGLVFLFGRRLQGVAGGMLATGLLLFLRLNIGFDTGLPLQETARSIRYDLAPVPFTLAACLVVLRPTPRRAVAAGVLLSLATLMQFYAAFFLLPVCLYLLLEAGPLRERVKLLLLVAAAAAVVALPYAAYIAPNLDEFEGQTSTLERRIKFTDPGFYVRNVERESKRFPFSWISLREALTDRPSSKAAILIGLPLSAAAAGWRALKERTREQRLLFFILAVVPLEYAVLEAQKIYFYWIGFMPFLCIGLASLLLWALDYARANRPAALLEGFEARRLAVAGAASIFLALVFSEGVYAQYQGTRVWDHATDYLSLREQLGAYVPPGSHVLGATSLWWAMPDTQYRSYYLLFYHTNPRIAEETKTISQVLDGYETDYVVLTRTARFFLLRLVPTDYFELSGYLLRSGEEIANLEDRSYGFIEIWKIDRSKRPPPAP